MKWTNDFIKAAAIRAIRTGAQTLLSMLGVGMAITDVNWLQALSVTVVAMLISVLTSIVTGLPETKIDGVIDASQFEDVDGIQAGDIARFKVIGGGDSNAGN